MKDQYFLSNAELKDVNNIYNLGKKINELKFSKRYPFHDVSELKDFVKNKKENIFLAVKKNSAKFSKGKKNNEIVGFLYAKILSFHSGGWCMLDNIAVDKKYRNLGFGTKLLKELYRILKTKKIGYVQVLEDVHDKKTRKFWKEKGYKESKIFVWTEKEIK
jgi:ribosomal protein S18 acetylase RimI-like enzyme